MKYLALTILLNACSFLSADFSGPRREIAQYKASNSNFEVALTRAEIFPNGINSTFIKAQINIDEKVDPALIEVISNGEIIVSKFTQTKGVWVAQIRPISGSEDMSLYLQYKNYRSPTLVLKTFNTPVKDKLEDFSFSPNAINYYQNIAFSKPSNGPEGVYESFHIFNNGINRIAPINDSNRSFEFSNDEYATQNMSFMVTDSPNSTTSHSMLTEFMLFPRNYLYNIALIREDLHVTLATGEKMIFNKNGEVIGGVFEEGPIDISGDRFKRHYANLKYKGKGILLRANARGQMPQQGQFETTKIDMDYGLKYSADVLIINGTTGQRCRRPKSDFWSSADVSVIAFKFPTDKEFNQYLKSKCGFEIPMLEQEQAEEEDITVFVENIWHQCQSEINPRSCVQEGLRDITNSKTRVKVRFELEKKVNDLQKKEETSLPSLIENESKRIHTVLKSDWKWVKDVRAKDCLPTATTQLKLSLRFHDPKEVMSAALGIICQKLQNEIEQIIKKEGKELYKAVLKDLSWLDLNTAVPTSDACFIRSNNLISTDFTFSHQKDLYQNEINEQCADIEESSEYLSWLQTNTSTLEVMLKEKAIALLTESANRRANLCLRDFPVNSSLERIRFKRQREACLIDHWPVLEQFVIDDLKKDPLVQKAKYSVEPLREYLDQQKRPIQLRIIKQYFN